MDGELHSTQNSLIRERKKKANSTQSHMVEFNWSSQRSQIFPFPLPTEVQTSSAAVALLKVQ